MVHTRNKLLISVLALGLAGGVIVGTGNIYAQTNDPMSSIISKIAQKFNLKEEDVKAVFDEHKKERQAGMQKKLEERLNKHVKDGKITEAQKKALLTKLSEAHEKKLSELESFKNMVPEQRKEAMQKKHNEIRDWASQNNISEQTLREIMGGFSHKGFRMNMVR